MTTLQTIRELYRHMEWADSAVWSAVFGCEAGPSDGKIREDLYHSHMVQHAFLRAWRGEAPDQPYPKFEDAAALAAWGRDGHRELVAHLESLGEASLAKPMPLPWAARVKERMGREPQISTVGDTVLQVVLHSVHHRGQINRRLREVGGKPPLADYIAWVWMGRPDAAWPSLA